MFDSSTHIYSSTTYTPPPPPPMEAWHSQGGFQGEGGGHLHTSTRIHPKHGSPQSIFAQKGLRFFPMGTFPFLPGRRSRAIPLKGISFFVPRVARSRGLRADFFPEISPEKIPGNFFPEISPEKIPGKICRGASYFRATPRRTRRRAGIETRAARGLGGVQIGCALLLGEGGFACHISVSSNGSFDACI